MSSWVMTITAVLSLSYFDIKSLHRGIREIASIIPRYTFGDLETGLNVE